MAAKFIAIGEPAHDAERQALRCLVEGLPSTFTVYGNAWLVERTGVIYELDAIVVAPFAVFVVEIKSYRGRIEGTDHDWYIPNPIPSPLKLNRLTAQALKSLLKRESYQAGQLWVEGLVFLSATTDSGVKGPASKDRIHTRKTILAALQDQALIERLSNRRNLTPTSAGEKDLLKLLQGVQSGPKPIRRVREYEIIDTISVHDTFTELLGKNSLSGDERLLRIYSVPQFASDEKRKRTEDRARWEATVLGRLGRSEGVQSADPPFRDEAGIVLPLEYFKGITLTTWLERYGPDVKGKERADLTARTDLWMNIAKTIDEVHRQGVVHRLLRPEVVLVEDVPKPKHARITGFDLAKQLTVDTAISVTSLADDRLIYAAPEVVNAFSSAEPASDQFSLGAILALILTGKPLFDNTRQYLAARRFLRRVRDMAPRISLSLDEAVAKMVELRPADRYASLEKAIEAVRVGRSPEERNLPGLLVDPRAPIDPENLANGARVGTDYEILGRLGQGGMAVVYAARHLVSGKTRALKIAKSNDAAEEALRNEYQTLSILDHPNIVRVIDLTKMVEGALTLVMERVGGQTLRGWLTSHPEPEPTAQRRLAEDLLAGLEYLEQKSVTHKDLKPENLLVNDGRLTIIDFSLAGIPEDATYGGTALYRDPATARWTHATDRYAAALCLFELYAGRHAFDGRVPEPGQEPSVRAEDIDPPGLAAFFGKALDPVLERRFPSARAMREALLVALGEEPDLDLGEDAPRAGAAGQLDATTPLRLAGLARRAVNALARCQVHSVGQLLSMAPAQIRALHAIGTKTSAEIIALQEALLGRGLVPTATSRPNADPPLAPPLIDSPEPVQKLPLLPAIQALLERAGLPTVGAVATLTQPQLLEVPGVSRSRMVQIVEALHRFHQRSLSEGSAEGAYTLDRLWELAARPLKDDQKIAIERGVGLTGAPEPQSLIADDLGRSQPQVSIDINTGLAQLDVAVLAEAQAAMDSVLDGLAGVARLSDLGARLEAEWPADVVNGEGFVRLLVRVSPGSAHIVEDGIEAPIVARPVFDKDTLRAFVAEVEHLANRWPLVDPDAARRSLAALMPYFEGDPLSLGMRLLDDIRITETGHLFVPPLEPKLTLEFVLNQLKDSLTLDELKARVLQMFGKDTGYPDTENLLRLLAELDCRVQGEQVFPGRTSSVMALPKPEADALPATCTNERTAEEVVRDMLREAAQSRGFRMLVTPPERHQEIGRSVARALGAFGATWVSFEDAFFSEHADELPMLERASRFEAQHEALKEAAESTIFRLLEEHGKPGRVVVLGDTALLGLCEAIEFPRRLYDETLSGSLGFWIVVVPGVILNRQPRFNEGEPMWHLDGATLALSKPLPS